MNADATETALRQRIIDLERENAELRQQLARRVVVPGTRPSLLPDDRQLNDLRDIVLRRYRFLKTAQNEAHFDEDFTRAFVALCHLPRTMDGSLNVRLDKGVFLDRASDVLRRLGEPSAPITLGPFVCALVAHGDIAYAPLDHFPTDQAYGLGDHTGRLPDGTGWRALLDTRQVRVPSKPVEAFERARRRAGEVVGLRRQIGPTW